MTDPSDPSAPSLAAYQSDSGEPQLCRSAFLFLDILGTQAKGANDLKRTIDALQLARSRGSTYRVAIARWFSDNLGLAQPTGSSDDDDALASVVGAAAAHQMGLIQYGLAARGAITMDELYVDREVLYGPALNRAVTLEKTRAFTPRIVLDESAVRVARWSLIENERSRADAWQRTFLAVDGDDVTFVNYLAYLDFSPHEWLDSNEFVRGHGEYVGVRLDEHDGDPRVHDKYRWLAAYHDWFVTTTYPTGLHQYLTANSARPLNVKFRPFGTEIPVRQDPKQSP